MRVAIIRGDLPQKVLLADLEPTSQLDVPVEPVGQTRYVDRPQVAALTALLAAQVPASIVSTGDITFPLTINAGNQTLKIKGAAADPFTTVLITAAVYANITTLLAAINVALAATAFRATTHPLFPTTRISLYTLAKGEGVRIQNDTTAGGSTANTPLVLGAGGQIFTVPTSAALVTATVPVGGPVDVSAATVRTQLGAGLQAAPLLLVQDALAPRFAETDVAIKSFQVGDLAKFKSASFNPDPSRLPALTTGAAMVVLADDGVTAFTAPVPTLTNAQVNTPVAGAVTLTGVGLASKGSPNAEVRGTKVKFFTAPEARVLDQATIVAAGGTVSATSIVIPASKVPSGVVAGTKVQVLYTSLASNQFTLV